MSMNILRTWPIIALCTFVYTPLISDLENLLSGAYSHGFNFLCITFISVCDQPLRSTQPGHPFMSRCNEYQPKGGDTLRLGRKVRYCSSVGSRWNCVRLLLHTGHRDMRLIIKHYISSLVYLLIWWIFVACTCKQVLTYDQLPNGQPENIMPLPPVVGGEIINIMYVDICLCYCCVGLQYHSWAHAMYMLPRQWCHWYCFSSWFSSVRM